MCGIFNRRWRGFSYRHKPLDYVQIERNRHDKVSSSLDNEVYLLDIARLILSMMFCFLMLSFQERTLEEHKKLVERILKHDQKRRKRIEAAGIDYECPEIVSLLLLSFCGCSFVFKKYNILHLEFCSHFTYIIALAGR